jgi:hypothetical protein
MPAPPIQETKPIQVGEAQFLQHKFSVFRNNRRELFMVFYVDWSKDLYEQVGTERLLDTLANGVAADSGGKLVAKRAITLGNVPGFEVTVDVPNTGRITARVFQSGNRSYQASIGMPLAKVESNEIQEFLDSFRIDK